jgi:iron-sulfur cluster assembly accessory protein
MSTDLMEKTGISISPAAMSRIAQILSGDSENDSLRISVEGGGCSGFSYKYDLVRDDRQDDDLVFERDGAVILIDPISVQYMEGSEVDFVDDLMGQSFQIKNPNAVASCGCGTSFSI